MLPNNKIFKNGLKYNVDNESDSDDFDNDIDYFNGTRYADFSHDVRLFRQFNSMSSPSKRILRSFQYNPLKRKNIIFLRIL